MSRHTYRDELREKDPGSVSSEYVGGAHGCPGDYFFGAPGYEISRCQPILEKKCKRCWGETYAQERWTPDDND